MGPGYRHRYTELRRLADEKYDGWRHDAARMVVRYGEPEHIEDYDMKCGDILRSVEVWTYAPQTVQASWGSRFLFYRPDISAPRRLWNPQIGLEPLWAPGKKPPQDQVAMECAVRRGGKVANPLEMATGPLVPYIDCFCPVWDLIEQASALGRGPGQAAEAGRLTAPPPVNTEDLARLREKYATTSDPKASPLAVQTTVQKASAQATSPLPLPQPPKSVKDLPEADRQWLEEYVAPILMKEERDFFMTLAEPHQRETFREEFWKRREREGLPYPMGPRYRERYAELRRIADDQYDGWRHDAGRMILRYGEPTALKKLDDSCGRQFNNLEIWVYQDSAMGRSAMKFFFYRRSSVEPRKMWDVSVPQEEVFAHGSCRKTFEGLSLACRPQMGDPCAGTDCPEACEVYETYSEIRARQGSALAGAMEKGKLLAPAEVDTEDLRQLSAKMATTAPTEGARTLSVQGGAKTEVATAQTKPGASTAKAPERRTLSNKEIKEATERQAPKYRDFLQLVSLIITKDELQVFLQIADDYQKDRFIEAFWRRRSYDPHGLRVNFQEVYIRRVQTAMEQFKNLHNDRSKLFVMQGPPDAILPIDCEDIYWPIQIWYYERLEALKSKVYLLFYQPYKVGDYRLWTPMDGMGALIVGGNPSPTMPSVTARQVDQTRCHEWRTVQQAMSATAAVLGSGPLAMAGLGKLFEPPPVETEGIDQILSMTTDVAAGAVNLEVTKLVRFPEMRANKIGVDLSLLVPRTELKPREMGEEQFYNIDVVGEIVKGERLVDNFKYRFDFPAQEVGEKIPLTVRRYLYPGDYKIVLKVSDGNQNSEGRIADSLTVPEQADAPPPVIAAAQADARATLTKAQDVGLLPSAISILPIAKEIATGLNRIETRTAEGIRAVDFFLNGAKVMTKTRAPFSADLNFGPLPRKQTIRVVAYGTSGRAIGEDEYVVNEGREVFKVRILTPEKGARVSGPIRVAAAVVTPEGKALQKIEFYNNDQRVATLYQPPFEQTVQIKSSASVGYVRVVGTLEDGAVAEDVRYVNAPEYISEVTVDAVELYTTVTDKNRPVPGLTKTQFKVFEDGVIQKVENFEYVKNLPLTIGVVIDTSASMLEELEEAQKAALNFLDYSIGEKDRAFTVSFDNEPFLLCKTTNRKDKLARSLAGIRAEGSTALYDAVIYALYQFTGVKGKKALVILSDGKDTASKFDFDTMVEYVKKSGISIYGIGLKISGADIEVKAKLNAVTKATGGQSFYIDSAKGLEGVYKQINDELRSQYLLTYYSTNTDTKEEWRKVEIKVEPASLQARTISGYYP
jgi:Ca-activated chloride channel family protein